MTEQLHGGFALESETRANLVHHGMLVGAPTNASTQVTGTGASDYNVNIAAGILAVDGTIKEYAAQADYDLASSATGLLASGESFIVSIVAYKNILTGVVGLRNFAGAAATTGAQVAPTDAEITAGFGANTVWYRLADCTVNRTGATTVTQSYNNTVRPSGIYKTRARA